MADSKASYTPTMEDRDTPLEGEKGSRPTVMIYFFSFSPLPYSVILSVPPFFYLTSICNFFGVSFLLCSPGWLVS